MPAKIQEVTTTQKLVRKFALVGPITPQLDETVVPVVLLDDLSDVEEWTYGMGSDNRAAPGVGNFATWSLENPAGSGRVLQLLALEFSSTGVTFVQVHLNIAAPTLAGALVWLPQNLNGFYVLPVRYPVGQFHYAALGAGLGPVVVATSTMVANVQWRWAPEDLLIYPNQMIKFQSAVANTAGVCGIRWRERPLRADAS